MKLPYSLRGAAAVVATACACMGLLGLSGCSQSNANSATPGKLQFPAGRAPTPEELKRFQEQHGSQAGAPSPSAASPAPASSAPAKS